MSPEIVVIKFGYLSFVLHVSPPHPFLYRFNFISLI